MADDAPVEQTPPEAQAAEEQPAAAPAAAVEEAPAADAAAEETKVAADPADQPTDGGAAGAAVAPVTEAPVAEAPVAEAPVETPAAAPTPAPAPAPAPAGEHGSEEHADYPTLPPEFTYARGALSAPLLPLEVPRSLAPVSFAFGYGFSRRNNTHFLDDHTVLSAAGNVVRLLDISNPAEPKVQYIFGKDGCGVGAVTIHPSRKWFAVAEKGEWPNVYIYEYPSLAVYRICRRGTEKAYSDVNFSANGEKLVTVGAFPDFLLTVWDWKSERIILRSKAFSQEVYNARFSPDNDGHLTTSGVGHIRFWRMAATFTGLKLQGAIGKFGKVELSDITSFTQLPDGKVMTSTEGGFLLLWDDNFIKFTIARSNGSKPHSGKVSVVHLDRAAGWFVSAGEDGRICFWSFADIDSAEVPEEDPVLRIDPIYEVHLPEAPRIRSLAYWGDQWVIQSASGHLVNMTINVAEQSSSEPTILLNGHAAGITAVDTSPTQHYAATAGADGRLICWDYTKNKLLFAEEHNAAATSLSWLPTTVDPQGRTVAVGFADGVVRVYRRGKTQWKRLSVFKPHSGAVNRLVFSGDGMHLATGGEDKQVFLFSVLNTGTTWDFKPIGFIPVGNPVRTVSWNGPGTHVLITTTAGPAVQVEIPSNAPSTSDTFELSLPTKTFMVNPLRPKKVAPPPKPEGEEEPELTEEQKKAAAEAEERKFAPGNAVGALYVLGSSTNEFFLTVDGFSSNLLHECEWTVDRPQRSMTLATATTHFLTYSRSGRFLICGASDGSVWVRSHTAIRPFLRIASHDGAVAGATTSFDDKFLVSAGADGQLCVYRLDADGLDVSAAEISKTSDFVAPPIVPPVVKAAAPTPNEAIALPAAVNPAEHLLTVDELATLQAGLALEPPVTPPDVEDPAAEAVAPAPDITETGAYSIQEAKLKTEEDNRRRAAEIKKSKVREQIAELQAQFAAVRARNEAEADPACRLSDEDLVIDPVLVEAWQAQGDRSCEEVQKELAWVTARKEIGLAKLRGKFLDRVEVERIRLKALRSQYSVVSFRTIALPQHIQESLNAIKSLLDAEDPRAQSRAKTAGSSGEGDDDDGAGGLGGTGGGKRDHGTGAARHGWEQRLVLRRGRKAELAKLQGEFDAPDTEDPADVAAVQEAKDNMGDYKLKSSPNYTVPEHKRVDAAKKRRQMVLLEQSMFDIRMDFNRRFMKLRDLKRSIVQHIRADRDRLAIINEELKTPEQLWAPELDAAEFPELRNVVTESDLRSQAAGVKTTNALSSAEVLTALHSISASSYQVSDAAAAATLSAQIVTLIPVLGAATLPTTGAQSELEAQEGYTRQRRLAVEKAMILDQHERMISGFDNAVYALRRERLKLDADLRAAHLRLVLMYRELVLLRDLAKRDEALNTKLSKTAAEKAAVSASVHECKTKLAEKKAEIQAWEQKDALIMNEFRTLVPESHPAAAALLKIFKRKIKRARKRDDDGEDEDASEEEFDDDDDGDEDDDEDEEDACPNNCDQALYDKVLELREKRLDQEDVLNDFQKALEELKKAHDRHQQRQRQIDKDLAGTNSEIESFQGEKQRLLNKLHTVVTATLSQFLLGERERVAQPAVPATIQEEKGSEDEAVEAFDGDVNYDTNAGSDAGNASPMPTSMPSTLEQYLIFGRRDVIVLKRRIRELEQQNVDLQLSFKDLHRQKIRLRKEAAVKQAEIEGAHRKCDDLQMLKFGQLIDLDSLDKMTSAKGIDEITARIQVQETANFSDVSKVKAQLTEKQSTVLALTQANTRILQQIGELTAKNQRLERDLNAGGSSNVADAVPSQEQEATERAKLLQLVKLQAREIDALKAEIGMLRRKGGHVYAPTVPPPVPLE